MNQVTSVDIGIQLPDISFTAYFLHQSLQQLTAVFKRHKKIKTFYLEATAQDVWIVAQEGFYAVRVKTTARISQPGICVLPYAQVKALVTRCISNDTLLRFRPDNVQPTMMCCIILEGNKVRSELLAVSDKADQVSDFISMQPLEHFDGSITLSAGVLQDGFRKTAPINRAVKGEGERILKSVVMMQITANEISFQATDTYKLARVRFLQDKPNNLQSLQEKTNVVLPTSAVDQWLALNIDPKASVKLRWQMGTRPVAGSIVFPKLLEMIWPEGSVKIIPYEYDWPSVLYFDTLLAKPSYDQQVFIDRSSLLEATTQLQKTIKFFADAPNFFLSWDRTTCSVLLKDEQHQVLNSWEIPCLSNSEAYIQLDPEYLRIALEGHSLETCVLVTTSIDRLPDQSIQTPLFITDLPTFQAMRLPLPEQQRFSPFTYHAIMPLRK